MLGVISALIAFNSVYWSSFKEKGILGSFCFQAV